MQSHDTPSPRLSQLLWHHYRWHLWAGLAIWLCAVAAVVLFHYFKDRYFILHSAFYAGNQAAAIATVTSNSAWLAMMLVLSGLIPAAIGGLLRHHLLASLSRKAHTRNELVWKSLLVFELVTALTAFIPWPIAYNQFSISMVGRQFLVLFLFSLPWLITTTLASRKLAAALGLPRSS